MNRIGVALLSLIALTSCGRFQHYESTKKFEEAEVVQMSYVPATNGHTDGSWGLDSDLNLTYNFGTKLHTEEDWIVVFRCEGHGKTFAIHGKDFYSRAKVGQRVTLEYVDLLESDYDGKNEHVIGYRTIRMTL